MEDYLCILKEAAEEITSKEKAISVKDLAFCHRKAVFSKIDPIPWTNEKLLDHVLIEAAHDVTERLFMMYPTRFELEKEVQLDRIKGRIDVYDKDLNNILDIKVNREAKILLKPKKWDEVQIRYYMAMKDSDEGQLIYFMVNVWKPILFPIYMTEEERYKTIEKMKNQAESLQNAIAAGDPSLVNGIYKDAEMNFMCNTCPYLKKCRSLQDSNAVTVGAA
jgi:hypothetical protein